MPPFDAAGGLDDMPFRVDMTQQLGVGTRQVANRQANKVARLVIESLG